MATFSIKRGDTIPIISGVITDENGNALGLNGATVKFGVSKDKNGKPGQKLMDVAAEIVNQSAAPGDPDYGRVKYVWQPGDTGTLLGTGNFLAEFQATLADASIGTAPGDGWINIVVWQDIALPSA